jgi:tryptophan halogenase
MKKIVIVGSGTAGVICSTFFKSFWKNKVEVILIHDSKTEIIGVGESTIPSIFEYLNYIGINSQELFKNTNTTFKLGIKFKNWKNDGKSFYHNFNEPNLFLDDLNKTYHISSAYSILNDKYENDFYLQNHFLKTHTIPNLYPDNRNHALHIDAKKFSEYILDKFKQKINIINSKIINVKIKDFKIEKLILENGKQIDADLFIDASGFSKVLFKHLNPKWIDMSDYLPMNKSIPNPVKKVYDFIPGFTLSEATKNGWIWQVPLQNRYGTGYNYCSQFISDEDAKNDFNKWLNKNHKVELENDRIIEYKTGYYEKQWIGNCVAIGLSSGFVEPLESTAIHTIIRQAFYVTTFYNLNLNEYSIQTYNRKMKNIYTTIYDFIRLHYRTKRTDSEFHIYMNKTTPDWIINLEEKLKHTFINHHDFFDTDNLFTSSNYIALLNGLGLINSKNALKNYLSSNNFSEHAESYYQNIESIKKINRNNSIDHKLLIENIKVS